MLSTIQEQVIRAFGYGLKRVEVASVLDLSTEQVDRLVAQAYLQLHRMEKQLSTPSFTHLQTSTD